MLRYDRSRTRTLRRGLSLAMVAYALASAGCTQYQYYGYNGCGPMPAQVVPGRLVTAPSVVVCDTPTQVVGHTGSTSGIPAPASPMVVNSRPPRVVVSESGRSRFPWRSPDPDSGLATTSVVGSLDDTTTTK